jgi:hypothetical protein
MEDRICYIIALRFGWPRLFLNQNIQDSAGKCSFNAAQARA